jgi:hypothetical protein
MLARLAATRCADVLGLQVRGSCWSTQKACGQGPYETLVLLDQAWAR